MTLTIQRETLAQIVTDAIPLLVAHHEEVSQTKDFFPLDPDWNRYKRLEAAGAIYILAARDDGKLIGYFVWSFGPHSHCKRATVARDDIFYILPEYRGWAGYRLLREALRVPQVQAADLVLLSMADRRASYMMARLGMQPMATVYSGRLGSAKNAY
jgi:GNAT superfamily N-acetyltransferase